VFASPAISALPDDAGQTGCPLDCLSACVKDVPGHDDALDLVVALVYLGDLGVPHHALRWEVPGVAIAAKELDRVGGDGAAMVIRVW
jgi:hypothetical protein